MFAAWFAYHSPQAKRPVFGWKLLWQLVKQVLPRVGI
jgi:hypothetical protein